MLNHWATQVPLTQHFNQSHPCPMGMFIRFSILPMGTLLPQSLNWVAWNPLDLWILLQYLDGLPVPFTLFCLFVWLSHDNVCTWMQIVMQNLSSRKWFKVFGGLFIKMRVFLLFLLLLCLCCPFSSAWLTWWLILCANFTSSHGAPIFGQTQYSGCVCEGTDQ